MIYIMAHKAFHAPSIPGYAPLQVGAALNGDLGYLRDDAGENISEKNPYFCELTGLYWVWKNRDDAEKGLVHYRRYFTRSRMSHSYADVLPFERISGMLDGADIVVPRTKYNHVSNRDQLVPRHAKERHFDALRDSVARRSPEYLADFDAFFEGNTGHFMNMMVARREVFDGYCAWLFDILFDLEARVKAEWPQDDPKRMYGHLSERLLNVYIRRNGLRVAQCPMANMEFGLRKRLRYIRQNYTNRPRFWLRKHFSK